ncbi:hypothetical protein JCM17380_49080 [Desulfosporosinus burensis]
MMSFLENEYSKQVSQSLGFPLTLRHLFGFEIVSAGSPKAFKEVVVIREFVL